MNETNYGFLFNDITITDNVFNKKFKNGLGKNKINYEIDFYLYILQNNILFPMPKLLNYEDGNLTIQYISEATPLTCIINSSNVQEYISKIKMHLCIIHTIQKPISTEVIKQDLKMELNTKIINRFHNFDWESNPTYKSITTVNHIKIKNIHHYVDQIEQKMFCYLENRHYYNLIHGDTHLGNILVDKNETFYFIDPRGYFGESKLFGIYEYDFAKLMFGISGYSIFDNMEIDDLSVINNNLDIDFIKKYEYIFEQPPFDKITTLFCLSIWLGNNSCFSNINKKITSLMIAYYYCEKYLDC